MENNAQIQETEVQNEGVSFGEIFFVLKKNWLIIAIIIVVFVFGGIGYGLFINNPTYSSKTTAIIQADKSASTEASDYNYATYLVKSFPDMIKSDIVTNEIAEEVLELRYTKETSTSGVTTYKAKNGSVTYTEAQYAKLIKNKSQSIQKGIAITNTANSLILNITYSTKIPDGYTEEEIIKEVELISDLLVSKTQEVYGEKDSDDKYVYPYFADKMVRLTYASDATKSRGLTKITLISLLIGIIISVGFVLIKYFADDTLTSKEELERITGVNLLAFIEKSESRRSK